jgi:serine/threonine protein kinase
MPERKTYCELRRIELFLAQQLSEEEQAALEQHLEECGDCRSALEQQAARGDTWAAARAALRSDEATADGGLPRVGCSAFDAPGDEAEDFDDSDSALSWLTPSDDPRMLGRLGTYEIAGVIGRGGMGVVLKGLDSALNRYVAIKVLAPHLAANGSARLRFAREARAAAAVVHENVIGIHAVAEWNGMPYLVMTYVRGESLQRRLDRQGPLGVKEVLRVGRQAAAGLAAAHAQGMVHRDIKPANILLEDGVERLKITDFGLARAVDDARVTQTGVVPGTPQYMSPEQARGEAIDARSDLFSLGSVLYAACTGRAPFRAETTYGVLRRISDSHPRPIREVNPEVPDWLETIIARLHAKSPTERFATAVDVAELLEQCLAHLQQPTAVPLPARLLPIPASAESKDVRRDRARRRRWLAAVAGVAVVCLTLVFVVTRWPDAPLAEPASDRGAASTSSEAPLTLPPSENGTSDPDLDWDAAARSIETLVREGEAFRRRVETAWGDPPANPRASTETPSPSDSESQP